jgi:hypothetical protein
MSASSAHPTTTPPSSSRSTARSADIESLWEQSTSIDESPEPHTKSQFTCRLEGLGALQAWSSSRSLETA